MAVGDRAWPCELRAYTLAAEGLNYEQVAAKLGVRRKTARDYVLNVRRKHGLPKRPLELSTREREALLLAAQGYTYCEIAARMYVIPSTVRKFLRGARNKLGASNTTEAVWRLLKTESVTGDRPYTAANSLRG